jgi:hypothetical protein
MTIGLSARSNPEKKEMANYGLFWDFSRMGIAALTKNPGRD